MASDAVSRFASLPTRLLLDTCVLNLLQDEGGHIFGGELPEGLREDEVSPDLRALRRIFQVNERAGFEFVVSPLAVGELAAVPRAGEREGRVRWALDVLDVWQITVWQSGDQSVRQRRLLPPEFVRTEQQLMEIPDPRRSPYDRLLLLEALMANCDAFLTTDERPSCDTARGCCRWAYTH